MSQKLKLVQLFLLSLFACTLVLVGDLHAQRARFGTGGVDDFFSLQNQPQPRTLPPPPSNLTFPGANPPGSAGPQGGPVTLGTPSFQQPPSANPLPGFDPFASSSTPFPVFPRPQSGLQLPDNLRPQGGFPGGPNTNFNLPPGPTFGQPNLPFEGTGTDWLPSIDWTWTNQAWNSFRNDFLPRVLERPRARQTWIQGNGGNELSINDLEVATTLTWPRFLGGTQPLRISPGFIAHWWRGPDTAVTGVDLPPRALSVYLSLDHTTDPARGFGLDNNLTVGVFSDFDNLSSDSLRLTGRLVGWRRINEYMIGKIGVEYFDRIRIKLLPVVGIYANPNPDMKIDLTFPSSKISHRIPNFNNFEGWVYVGGEYGGGSWAIDRSAGFEDQVDINDVRAFIGIEWMGPRRVTGFFEVGYVFERELVFRTAPLVDIPIQDSFMIRSGFAF